MIKKLSAKKKKKHMIKDRESRLSKKKKTPKTSMIIYFMYSKQI